jgi:hypothetical protein
VNAEQAFDAFAAEWERGERPDPVAAVAAVDEKEREAFAVMLAAYLSAHPRADVTEPEVAARAADPASEPPQAWDDLLPALRARTGTTRGALVERLAEALGFPQARAQVGEYVHGLETGQLESRGVRPAVVAALAAILDVPQAVLEAGRRLPPAGTVSLALAFHREAPALAKDALAAASPAPEQPPIPEVDDLFTGDG